jgi:hypothetical protein
MNTPADVIPDELVLAAIERADLHRARDTPGVPIWDVYEHLALSRRSMRARRVRSQIDGLETDGYLEHSRRHGVQMWVLTHSGRRRLHRAHLAGNVPQLPESPQHRAWRNARTVAAQEIERFRESLRENLREATELLEAEPPARSDLWFELCDHLHRAIRRLGSAGYCLHEWVEPDDGRADIDDHQEPSDEQLASDEQKRYQVRRHGRRNVGLWETST